MNLLITKSCNRACPYCFAKKEVNLNAERSQGNISRANFRYYLDFLKENFIRDVKMLGGEPTMHPRFTELVDMAKSDGFRITVFTNGLWQESLCHYFQQGGIEGLEFLVNVNEIHNTRPGEYEQLEKVLALIGGRGQLGFNIFVEDFDLTFLRRFIDAHNLKRTIRLGLASPIVGLANASIAADQLRSIGARLLEQMDILTADDILVEFDCGFTYCMFDEEGFATVIKSTHNGLVSVCDFIGDVDYNLDVWPCFPLSKAEHLNLKNFRSLDDIRDHYQKRFAALRGVGTMDDCLLCAYKRRGQCCGGCLARGIDLLLANGDKGVLPKLGIEL